MLTILTFLYGLVIKSTLFEIYLCVCKQLHISRFKLYFKRICLSVCGFYFCFAGGINN